MEETPKKILFEELLSLTALLAGIMPADMKVDYLKPPSAHVLLSGMFRHLGMLRSAGLLSTVKN